MPKGPLYVSSRPLHSFAHAASSALTPLFAHPCACNLSRPSPDHFQLLANYAPIRMGPPHEIRSA
eukprot:49941-Chlamydomonas_euryale.AAC.1